MCVREFSVWFYINNFNKNVKRVQPIPILLISSLLLENDTVSSLYWNI